MAVIWGLICAWCEDVQESDSSDIEGYCPKEMAGLTYEHMYEKAPDWCPRPDSPKQHVWRQIQKQKEMDK